MPTCPAGVGHRLARAARDPGLGRDCGCLCPRGVGERSDRRSVRKVCGDGAACGNRARSRRIQGAAPVARTCMIPRSALILGLAGLVPFVWGTLSPLYPALGDWGDHGTWPPIRRPLRVFVLRHRDSGSQVGRALGLCNAGHRTCGSGRIWAVGASRTLGILVCGRRTPESAARWLAAGFVGLLARDYAFWRQGLAPDWWMQLRMMLTAGVLACLSIPVLVQRKPDA